MPVMQTAGVLQQPSMRISRIHDLGVTVGHDAC
jgi:hypothetical protein